MEIVEGFIALHRAGVVEWEHVNRAIEAYFLALGERRTPVRRPLHHRFDLELLTDVEVVQQFRFHRNDLPLLQRCLEIPNEVYSPETRCRTPGITALCILLRRLSYPNRLCDLESFFRMSIAALSSFSRLMVSHVMRRKGNLLSNLENHSWLNRERLAYYAEAVARKGAPLQNCWGFIDGTARHICRPSVNQEEYYSGHKRHHCIKFQSTVTPDGLIINLLGPFSGRRHDSGILNESGFIRQLQNLCDGPPPKYVIYGDAAYPMSRYIIKPYPSTNSEENATRFNGEMAKVRQAVEWGFGNVVKLFALVDFHKNMKILKQDVGNMYKVACLLTNCHTCLHGSQITTFFGTTPPSLEVYLQHNM